MTDPHFWRNETSGLLAPVVEKYLRGENMDSREIGTMRAYLRQWIMSPVWKGPEISGLRDMIESLNSKAQIDRWLLRAMDAGIDPL